MTPLLRSARARMVFTWSALIVAGAAILLVVMNLVVARALADQPVTRQVLTARQVGGTIVFEPREIQVVDALEQQVNQRTLTNLRRVSAVAVLALFPISLVIGWIVAGQVLAPVDRITRVARDIQASDLSRRIRLAGPDDEMKRLADTFDAMLDRIAEAIDEQRSFVQNASHELRTPLAVATTNLDVALSDADPDALRNRAEIARRALGRLGRLVDDLFLYARQQGREVSLEPVDIDRLAAAMVEDFTESAAGRHLDLLLVGGGAGVLQLDREAIVRAVSNLIDNAVRLAPPASAVTVATGRDSSWAWVGVRDQGPGIAAADRSRVWNRFWRSSDGGTGLGLAIVRQTAEAHSGRVTLTSELGIGSSFVIWLPIDDVGVPPGPDPLW